MPVPCHAQKSSGMRWIRLQSSGARIKSGWGWLGASGKLPRGCLKSCGSSTRRSARAGARALPCLVQRVSALRGSQGSDMFRHFERPRVLDSARSGGGKAKPERSWKGVVVGVSSVFEALDGLSTPSRLRFHLPARLRLRNRRIVRAQG